MDCKNMPMKAGSMPIINITASPLIGTVKTIECGTDDFELGFIVTQLSK
jgi:hypothetical protein